MTTPAPFTPPRSCSTSWKGTNGYFIVGARCSSGSLANDPGCYPSTAAACPYNWRPVTIGSLVTTCCPGEFGLAITPGWCYSSAGGYVLEGITCAPSVSPTGVKVTYSFTPGVWAFAASYVARVTSSVASSTAASSSATPPTTSSPTVRSSSTPDTASRSSFSPSSLPNPSPKPSLSAGAIAGIVIGSVLGVALILAAIFFLKKRHTKSKVTPEHQPFTHPPPQVYYDTQAELDATGAGQYKPIDARMSQISHMSPVSPMPHTMAHPVELESHNVTPYPSHR